MKSTGIIRKVDELGRVVIPKELRKTSLIGVGTPLEIYTDEGSIILKKYSILKNLSDFATEVAESLNAITKGKVIIYDKNEVVAVSGGIGLKSATNFFIENKLDKIHNKCGMVRLENCNIDVFFQPIKVDGNIEGGIMLWDIPDNNFSKDIINCCECMAIYLGKLMQ